MKIAVHLMSKTHWFAHRTIMQGIADGFCDIGHDAVVITNEDIAENHLLTTQYDILYTSSHWMYRRALTTSLRRHLKSQGTRIIMRLDSWKSLQPLHYQLRDGFELRNDKSFLNDICSGNAADLFVSPIEQGDERMIGFTQTLNVPYFTVPFAVSKAMLDCEPPNYPSFAEAVFLGSNLGQKKAYIKKHWTALSAILPVTFIGQDWTFFDTCITNAQKLLQIFQSNLDLSYLRTAHHIRSESAIYKHSLVNLNCHLPEQRRAGGDCNERTFKIAGSGGVQLVDNVACISKYYTDGSDLFICKTPQDWVDICMMLLADPNLWSKVATNARLTTINNHTYSHRCIQMLDLLGANRTLTEASQTPVAVAHNVLQPTGT